MYLDISELSWVADITRRTLLEQETIASDGRSHRSEPTSFGIFPHSRTSNSELKIYPSLKASSNKFIQPMVTVSRFCWLSMGTEGDNLIRF